MYLENTVFSLGTWYPDTIKVLLRYNGVSAKEESLWWDHNFLNIAQYKPAYFKSMALQKKIGFAVADK